MPDYGQVVFHDGSGGKIAVDAKGHLVAVYEASTGRGLKRAGPAHALRIFRAALAAKLAEDQAARQTFAVLTGGYQPVASDEHGDGSVNMLQLLAAFNRQGPSMFEPQPPS